MEKLEYSMSWFPLDDLSSATVKAPVMELFRSIREWSSRTAFWNFEQTTQEFACGSKMSVQRTKMPCCSYAVAQASGLKTDHRLQ